MLLGSIGMRSAVMGILMVIVWADASNADPNGSYARTCNSCRSVPGQTILSCSCRKIDQTYKRTSLSYDLCAREEIENIDGDLRCVAAAPSQKADADDIETNENDDGSERQMRATPPIEDPAPPVRRTQWRALAAGLLESTFQNSASVASSGTQSTKHAAEEEAMQHCLDNGNPNCQILTSFNVGCGYVTSGKSGQQVGYGSGTTAQQAYDACTSRGLSCSTPVGGCIE